MNIGQLNEEPSVTDELLGSFSNLKAPDDELVTVTDRESSAREPIKIQGIDHNTFAQWLRSKEQVRHAIQKHLETPKMSLKNCIALYTEYNIKIDDFVTLNFPVKSVLPYREYDRDMKNGYTGKMSQNEYTNLMKDISKHGVKEPGILDISVNGADYQIQLGEGNHRLRIAEKLGIEKFPLTFSYRFG